MDNLERQGSTELARPLSVLVPLIKDELEAGDNAGLEHYRKAGEMLIEAKAQVEHGEWTGWVERNFHLSHTTAKRYMTLASLNQNDRRRSFSTLSAATEPHREHHQSSWQAPVREIASRVNTEALARESQGKQRELDMLRKLSHQLIDIGYKVLAAKLHPDKSGGSSEAMARLNKVRNLLKEAI